MRDASDDSVCDEEAVREADGDCDMDAVREADLDVLDSNDKDGDLVTELELERLLVLLCEALALRDGSDENECRDFVDVQLSDNVSVSVGLLSIVKLLEMLCDTDCDIVSVVVGENVLVTSLVELAVIVSVTRLRNV